MLSANSLDFTMIGGVGDIVYRAVRFAGYYCDFDGEHSVMTPYFPEPSEPAKIGPDYNLNGQDLLSNLRNLFMALNAPHNTLDRNEEIRKWCTENIHPYDIDLLCEMAENEDPGTVLSTSLQQWGCFFIEDFMKDLEPLINTFEFALALSDIKDYRNPTRARGLYYEGRYADGYPFLEQYQGIEDDDKYCDAVLADMDAHAITLIGLFPNFEMRLKLDKQTGKIGYGADVKSVFDIAWYTLGRIVADVAPPVDQDMDHMFRQGKIMTCEICGNTFVRTGSQQRYCENPDCKAEVNRRNRRNSYQRKKQAMLQAKAKN